MEYAELHCHSYYSFLHGTSSPAELVEQAVKLGLNGLALTDDDGLYGVIPFVRKCEELNLSYCVGASITVGQDDMELKPAAGRLNDDHIVLLCQNLTGYHNLSQLITRARHARPKGEAGTTLDAISELSGGLICLVGGKEGNIPKLVPDNQVGRASAEIEPYRRDLNKIQSKKAVAEMQSAFITAATQNGVSHRDATEIFGCIAGFAGYGFCKSHALSFAHLVYQAAWLKCYYPDAFLAALLNNQLLGFYPTDVLINDAKRRSIRILPVNVNQSEAR